MTAAAPEQRALTAREVSAALFQHFTSQGYAVLCEVEAAPEIGLRDHIEQGALIADAWEQKKPRRVDLLALRKPRKEGIGEVESLAVEIKVSRADFLADVRNPAKQARWRDLTHRMAYAAPKGLVAADEVPEGCGLLEVEPVGDDWCRSEWAKRAPYGEHSPDVPTWLALTFAHRACWAEGRAKGFLARRGEPTTEEEFRAEIVHLKRELTRETNRADRERGMHLGWKEAYAAAGGLPCAFCDQEIRPHVRAADFGLGGKWHHRTKANDKACEAIRTMQAEASARHAWEHHGDDRSEWTRGQAEARYPGEPWRYFMHVPAVMPQDDNPTEDDEETPTDD